MRIYVRNFNEFSRQRKSMEKHKTWQFCINVFVLNKFYNRITKTLIFFV